VLGWALCTCISNFCQQIYKIFREENENLKEGDEARLWWLIPVILDRDQEDCGLRLAGANIHQTLSRKYPTQNRADGVAQVAEQ
jgi:hypothetical protein